MLWYIEKSKLQAGPMRRGSCNCAASECARLATEYSGRIFNGLKRLDLLTRPSPGAPQRGPRRAVRRSPRRCSEQSFVSRQALLDSDAVPRGTAGWQLLTLHASAYRRRTLENWRIPDGAALIKSVLACLVGRTRGEPGLPGRRLAASRAGSRGPQVGRP